MTGDTIVRMAAGENVSLAAHRRVNAGKLAAERWFGNLKNEVANACVDGVREGCEFLVNEMVGSLHSLYLGVFGSWL